jgi:hypothetical protein
MRKRLAMLFTPVVIALALMLPATTAASSLGAIKITSQFCKGTTVHVTFKVTKNSGHYATRFTLKATGQGSNNATYWANGGSKSYSYTIYNPMASAYFTKTLTYNSNYKYSRIQGVAKWYDGRYLIGTAKISSGYC